MLIVTLFFSLLRPYNTVVYAPKLKYADKKHAPPILGKGLFAWFSPINHIHEADLVDKVGLDAVVFLRFTKMCRNVFLLLSIIGCGVLIPVHIFGSSNYPVTSATERIFATMTPQYVLRGDPMWAHVACTWAFDIVIMYFLWSNYKAVARLRRHYFESPEYQQSLHSRSIWLRDLPASERSDEGILKVADSVQQTDGIPRTAIARNVKDLPELIDDHSNTVRKLESILAKYLKNPDKLPSTRPTLRPSKKDRKANPTGKVDAIDYLTARIKDLEAQIKTVRESIDRRNPMGYGFATYERIEAAHTVAYAARNKHPQGVTIRLAPKPHDLIWKNLPLSKGARRSKRFVNSLWVALLTVVWIVPNALMAAFITRLANLAAVWPAFATSFNNPDNHTFWAVVQAVAVPGLTSLFYLCLPIIFRRLSTRAGDMTKTSREKHVTHKLYAFFVFNNLILFSLIGGVWSFVSIVIASRQAGVSVIDAITSGNLPSRIMVALCTVSPFWVTWLLQRNLGAAVDLAQFITLTWVWFARTFMSPTPRQAIEWTAPPAFDYASYYNYFLFYSTVSLCYATIQPLVLVVTFLYFVIDCPLKKYLLLYVFITKTESGGQFWNILFNRMLFATFLANCIAAVVIKAAFGSWTMLGCMVPLPILLLGFKIYCSRTFEDQCRYYTKASLSDPESLPDAGKKPRRTDRVGVKFGHPALYKPLITPMVHAKAQHVLADIYRGRLDQDNRTQTGYSDIALESMSTTHPGKSARFAPGTVDGPTTTEDMFEVVPESNLDFAFFKNRAGFGDEHGGGGELYGRPQDLMSERSQTPASFMTDGSGTDSRSGSPAPQFRLHRADDAAFAPPFGDGDYEGDAGASRGRGLGRGHLYTLSNASHASLASDSERHLLGAAGPLGTASREGSQAPSREPSREPLGLDRWRTGGSGYVGVAGAGDEEPLEYQAYRPGRA
jgi:hypothetical protein